MDTFSPATWAISISNELAKSKHCRENMGKQLWFYQCSNEQASCAQLSEKTENEQELALWTDYDHTQHGGDQKAADVCGFV